MLMSKTFQDSSTLLSIINDHLQLFPLKHYHGLLGVTFFSGSLLSLNFFSF